LAAIAAEVEHLTAQLIPTQEQFLAEAENLETNLMVDKGRFYVDVENMRLRILQLRALIASDQMTLEDLAMEIKVTERLLEQEVVVPYELQKVKGQYNALAKKIEENENLLQQAKDDLQQAQERFNEFIQRQPQHPTVDSALDVIRKQIAVQERLMDRLLARQKLLELKSPVHGIIVQAQAQTAGVISPRLTEKIFRDVGEVVGAGDPIFAVAEVEPAEILAYISEQQLQSVKNNMMVELVKNNEPLQIASSQVTSIGPAVELIPQRLWRNPNIPQWGRPIVVKVPSGLKVIPGEIIAIRGL
jgi:multidrug resistance efflux pump